LAKANYWAAKKVVLSQKNCPICKVPAANECEHLALAAEGRDFVRRCIDLCQARRDWDALCHLRREHLRKTGEWSPECEDFMWLETAFCAEFLKPLRWFGGMDHEWRTDSKLKRGGFWVLLWTKEPRRLWWELRDAIERRTHASLSASPAGGTGDGPWLFDGLAGIP
jgi:hypothetical protein